MRVRWYRVKKTYEKPLGGSSRSVLAYAGEVTEDQRAVLERSNG